MAVRVGMNGFGRTGRLVLRAAMEAKRKDIVFVAINDLGSAKANAHLLAHDSVHGPFPGRVSATRNAIKIGGQKVRVLAERDPAKLPWAELGVDIVLECTGLFTKREAAAQHLEAASRRARPRAAVWLDIARFELCQRQPPAAPDSREPLCRTVGKHVARSPTERPGLDRRTRTLGTRDRERHRHRVAGVPRTNPGGVRTDRCRI